LLISVQFFDTVFPNDCPFFFAVLLCVLNLLALKTSSFVPSVLHHQQLNQKKHHQQFVCTNDSLRKESADTQRIKLLIQKADAARKQRKDEKKKCPYGCGKSWKQVYSSSVKKHILGDSCPNFVAGVTATKIKEFYAKRSRFSVRDVVF
jgi:hypothetical protein